MVFNNFQLFFLFIFISFLFIFYFFCFFFILLSFYFLFISFRFFFPRIYKNIFVLLKNFRVIFVFLLVLGGRLTFSVSLKGDIDP
jgi:hypothetical protein